MALVYVDDVVTSLKAKRGCLSPLGLRFAGVTIFMSVKPFEPLTSPQRARLFIICKKQLLYPYMSVKALDRDLNPVHASVGLAKTWKILLVRVAVRLFSTKEALYVFGEGRVWGD